MTQTHDVVQTVFTHFPVSELSSDEHRQVFDKIKNRLGQSGDPEAELRDLYKVKGFSDFAAVILWILERSQKDPSSFGATPEDETLLLSTFRKAMGEQSFSSAPVSSAGDGAADEKGFASQLEQFSEAVQSGIEGRGQKLEDLFNECGKIVNRTADADLKALGALLGDFLKYIAENELLDDVRVINIASNIASSVSQWAVAPSGARHGLMEEALGMLRDFKTHFE